MQILVSDQKTVKITVIDLSNLRCRLATVLAVPLFWFEDVKTRRKKFLERGARNYCGTRWGALGEVSEYGEGEGRSEVMEGFGILNSWC